MAHQIGKEEVELEERLEGRLAADFNHPGPRADDVHSIKLFSDLVLFATMTSLVLTFFEELQVSSPDGPDQNETRPFCEAQK